MPYLFLFLAALLFESFVLGFSFLNPQTPWLTYGDQTQHFLGWAFFKDENWHFPPGLIENYNTFAPSSIGLTDSIPLFAFLFKMGSPFLPENFQYFGLWALLNTFLNGVFGVLIAQKITQDKTLQVLMALFLMTSTLFAANLHGALGAHFLILASMYFYNQNQHRTLPWSILITCAALIHPYLLAMVFAFLFFKTLFLKKIRFFLEFLFLILWAAFLSFLAGHFVGGNSVFSYGGFGAFRAHLGDFFSPRSDVFLGLGIFILSFFVLIKWAQSLYFKQKIILFSFQRGFFGCVFVLSAYALMSEKFAKIPILHFFANIFRANARFIWVLFYLLLILILAATLRFFSQKRAKIMLTLAFCAQFYPQSSVYFQAHHDAQAQQLSPRILHDERWGNFAKPNAQILMFINKHAHTQNYTRQAEPVALFAQQNKMKINYFYTARTDYAKMMAKQSEEWFHLINGNAKKNTLYVFFDDFSPEMLKNSLPQTYVQKLLFIENYAVLSFLDE